MFLSKPQVESRYKPDFIIYYKTYIKCLTQQKCSLSPLTFVGQTEPGYIVCTVQSIYDSIFFKNNFFSRERNQT